MLENPDEMPRYELEEKFVTLAERLPAEDKLEMITNEMDFCELLRENYEYMSDEELIEEIERIEAKLNKTR